MRYETPLNKVTGAGAAHTGSGTFAHQRITALILIPLSVWFANAMIGLAGTSDLSVLIYFRDPWHAILMAVFVLAALSHFALGIREVITDYVPHGGLKLFITLMAFCFATGVALVCFFSLLRIAL